MDTSLLGKQVLPLPVDRSLLPAVHYDRSGAGAYLRGDEAMAYYRTILDAVQEEIDEDSIRMEWYVFAVCADSTYELRSDIGYIRSGTERDEFVLVPDGNSLNTTQ